MDNALNQVSSELYSEFKYESDAKPTVNPSNVVSKFSFIYPTPPPKLDCDGDFVVTRKLQANDNSGVVEIEHSQKTDLSLVGLQVWRGALLLSDWLLHKANELTNANILELGSGTGLTSIVASIFSNVICTDVDKGDILKLLQANVNRNLSLTKHKVIVTEFDFTRDHVQDNLKNDVLAFLPEIKIIIAADVIYDNQLTEDFVKTLELFLSYRNIETVYIALEKRYVFTTADCDVSAPCFDFFLDCLQSLKNVSIEELPISFPKYFHYERVKELVLLKIKNNKSY